jgi:hypothetical protein
MSHTCHSPRRALRFSIAEFSLPAIVHVSPAPVNHGSPVHLQPPKWIPTTVCACSAGFWHLGRPAKSRIPPVRAWLGIVGAVACREGHALQLKLWA